MSRCRRFPSITKCVAICSTDASSFQQRSAALLLKRMIFAGAFGLIADRTRVYSLFSSVSSRSSWSAGRTLSTTCVRDQDGDNIDWQYTPDPDHITPDCRPPLGPPAHLASCPANRRHDVTSRTRKERRGVRAQWVRALVRAPSHRPSKGPQPSWAVHETCAAHELERCARRR